MNYAAAVLAILILFSPLILFVTGLILKVQKKPADKVFSAALVALTGIIVFVVLAFVFIRPAF